MNLKAIVKCAPLGTYTEIRAFLSLVGHYRQFIKVKPDNNPLTYILTTPNLDATGH